MEVGGGGVGRLYTYRYTVTNRMTSALRWAAMRAILMYKVSRQCPQTTTFKEKGEPKQNRTEVPPLTSLKPVLTWAICLLANLVGSIRRT